MRTGSIVAVDALVTLVALLGLQRERRDRPRLKPLQRDRLSGILAIAVRPIVDAGHGGIDLCDQLALPITRPELDRPVGLRGGTIGKIRMIRAFVLERSDGFLRLTEDFGLPGIQLAPEILTLPVIHERLIVVRTVALVDDGLRHQASLSPPGHIVAARIFRPPPRQHPNPPCLSAVGEPASLTFSKLIIDELVVGL